MTKNVRTQWASPARSVPVPDPSTPGVPAPPVRTEPDPLWWIAPLAGTLAAPVLALLVSGTENVFAGSRFLLIGSLACAFALIGPSWFGARTTARREKRIGLAVAGCGLAAGFPSLTATFGWILFLVLLLTGNVNS